MRVSWATNLYDYEGDEYEKCILLFCGKNTILKFKDSVELDGFICSIRSMMENIIEQENHDN
jgi:hypothetical protein